jgi:hypothetical protein
MVLLLFYELLARSTRTIICIHQLKSLVVIKDHSVMCHPTVIILYERDLFELGYATRRNWGVGL